LEFDIARKTISHHFDRQALMEIMLSVAERLGMPPMYVSL
jgi:hypothetical protein